MSDLIASQPKFSFPQVIDFVQDHYGLRVSLRSLESERDQNFLATDSDGQRFVVRIANHRVDPRFLDLENLALLRLAESGIADRVPSLVMSGKGEPMAWVSDGAERFPIRMVGFIEGELLAGVRPQADGLLYQLGGLLGSLTATLSTLDHPASRREFHWDLDQVSSTLSQYREFAGDFDLLDGFLERYQGRVLPRRESLRKSIIHNDANDHNVIVLSLIHI